MYRWAADSVLGLGHWNFEVLGFGCCWFGHGCWGLGSAHGCLGFDLSHQDISTRS